MLGSQWWRACDEFFRGNRGRQADVSQGGSTLVEGQLRCGAVTLVDPGSDQGLPGTLVKRIDKQQPIRGGDDCVGLVLFGEYTFCHGTSMPAQTPSLLPQPLIKRGVDSDEIIEKRPLKQFQPLRLRYSRCPEHKGIHPDLILLKQKVIAIRLQQPLKRRSQSES
jgi:hypothetical protein